MTTPERLRRRQRIEMGFLALVTIAGGITAFVLDSRDDRYSTCLLNYIEADSETGALRSGLVAQESQATREIIRRVFAATTREESLDAYADYRVSLDAIDKARADNPVREFDSGVCQ